MKKMCLFAVLFAFLLLPNAQATDLNIVDAEQSLVGSWSAYTWDEVLMSHDTGGDAMLLFLAKSIELDNPNVTRGVDVAIRGTGQVVGEFPAPPEGWTLPFAVHVEEYDGGFYKMKTEGTVIIFDGQEIKAAGIVVPRFLEYNYSYNLRDGFQATLIRNVAIPLNSAGPGEMPNAPLYPTSFSPLPDGRMVLADTVLGAIWLSDQNWSNWQIVYFNPNMAWDFIPDTWQIVCEDGTPRQGLYIDGMSSDGTVKTYPYALPVPEGAQAGLPGLHGIVYVPHTDEVIFNRTGTPGGIYRIARTELVDTTKDPMTKQIVELVPPTPGVSDWIGEPIYNRWLEDSPWLYFQRGLANFIPVDGGHPYGSKAHPLFRVHLDTGEIQYLGENIDMLNLTSNSNVLPPLFPKKHGPQFTYFVASNVFQHLMPNTNICIQEHEVFPPVHVPVFMVKE